MIAQRFEGFKIIPFQEMYFSSGVRSKKFLKFLSFRKAEVTISHARGPVFFCSPNSHVTNPLVLFFSVADMN